ncbi:olfactory receptor 6N1-like [Hyperolius riggenbachi]|uniref:olfactory receptor 6N1-like n=1 Tax=Hyperolius riggenbachi TaxID=752182 RepID=UPI0035A2C5FF
MLSCGPDPVHPSKQRGDVLIQVQVSATYKSNITTIIFLGFSNLDRLNLPLFILVLLIYCATVCGNLLIIKLVYFSKILHTPMYFLLSQLSLADVILTTDIAPNMLNILFHERASIPFAFCINQLYFFSFAEASECLLLTVMSYDRYLAICSPLHYASIMNYVLCIKFILMSWMLSCCIELIVTCSVSRLQFCGPNTIDHFFCDFYPLLELSCSDVSTVQMEATLFCVPVIVLPFLVIVVSYVYIALTILKIASFSGRIKSFSTCSSHLTVVFIFYGTLMAMYMLPKGGQSKMISKTLAMLYTVLTPFLNPFIYSLRNKDIKDAFRNVYLLPTSGPL